MNLHDKIKDIIRKADFGGWTYDDTADAILDLKIEYFDNSIATGPRYWTKTLRELEGE